MGLINAIGVGVPFHIPGGGAAFSGLLDDYPLDQGWSLRLLKSDYTGALVRIRRSSDSAEKDFYPDSNNELSMSSEDGAGTSLSTWISTDSGYVTTWYSQNSGTNLTQTTAASQPRIVNAGTLDTYNGKAAMQFDGSDDWLTGGTSILDPNGTTTLFSAAVVSNVDVNDTIYARSRFASADGRYAMYGGSSTNQTMIQTSAGTDVRSGTGGAGLYNQLYNGTSHIIYKNDSALQSSSVSATMGSVSSRFLVGAYNNSGDTGEQAGYYFPYMIQELVVSISDETSNRSAINTNINNHYGIY